MCVWYCTVDYILLWRCSSPSIDLNVLTGFLFYFCVSLFFLFFSLSVSCCHWWLVVTDQWPIAGGGWCAGAIWSKFVPTAELIIVSFPSTRTSPASDGYRPARKHQKRPVSKTLTTAHQAHYCCRLGPLRYIWDYFCVFESILCRFVPANSIVRACNNWIQQCDQEIRAQQLVYVCKKKERKKMGWF